MSLVFSLLSPPTPFVSHLAPISLTAGAHGVGIGCHTIAVVSSEEGLRELATLGRASPTPLDLTQPVVAQEYIYHRGVMFKVYVVGSHAVFACRPSLGEQDLLPDPEGRTTHVRFFQGVSRKPVADLLSDEDDDGEGARGGEAAGGGLVSQLSRDGCSTPELLEAAGSGLPDWFVSGLGR